MKKIFILLFLSATVAQAQWQAKDTTKYDYVGVAMDSTLFAGDTDYINQLFDKEFIMDKILIKSDESYIQSFNEGFKEGMKTFDYGQRILQEMGESGTYDFLRSSIKPSGAYHLLFRIHGDDGLNYHDYKLKEINGEVKIVDVYYFTSGEYFSKTLRDLYSSAVARKPNMVSRFLKTTVVDDSKNIIKVKTLMQQGKYQEAYNVFKKLSSEFREQKAVKILAVQITANLDEDLYERIIADYEKSFPNDPSLYLISLDGEFLRGNYENALQLINNLDKAVGGDEFLDFYRTNVYFGKGDYVNAEKYARQLLYNYPFYVDAHVTLVTIFVEQKRYEEALKPLEKFYSTFELTKEGMKEAIADDYPEFSKSKVYQDWLKE
jgi:tetratricopeptide (TPR) repeat protein